MDDYVIDDYGLRALKMIGILFLIFSFNISNKISSTLEAVVFFITCSISIILYVIIPYEMEKISPKNKKARKGK